MKISIEKGNKLLHRDLAFPMIPVSFISIFTRCAGKYAVGQLAKEPMAKKKNPKQRPNVDATYFKTQLTQVGMSQRELARALGKTPIAVTLMFQGKRRIQMSDATEMARLFSVPLEEVLEASGITTAGLKRKESVAIVGWIDGQNAVHLGAPRGDRTAPAPAWGVSKRLRALRYQTNGTPLEGMNAALVYFNRADDTPNHGTGLDDVNRISVIETADGRAFLGTIKRAASGSFRKFDLFTMNGLVIALEASVKSVSPVVWVKM